MASRCTRRHCTASLYSSRWGACSWRTLRVLHLPFRTGTCCPAQRQGGRHTAPPETVWLPHLCLWPPKGGTVMIVVVRRLSMLAVLLTTLVLAVSSPAGAAAMPPGNVNWTTIEGTCGGRPVQLLDPRGGTRPSCSAARSLSARSSPPSTTTPVRCSTRLLPGGVSTRRA